MKPAELVRALEKSGLLLMQDLAFPNVVTLVTGEVVRGSWWGHKMGHEIFDLLSAVEDHDDVLFLKLLSGKVTLVHRKLWPAVLAVATAREPWQMARLSSEALALLKRVDAGEVIQPAGKPGKELEDRLLVFGQNIHTPSGKHVLEISSWKTWADQSSIPPMSLAAAKEELTKLVSKLNAASSAKAKLPWR